MRASITVEATAPGSSSVLAVLQSSSEALINTNYISLSGLDELTASANGTSAILRPSSFLGYTSYTADLGAGSGGSTFTIALERSDEESAPSSTVVVPPEFQLASSTHNASRSNDGIVLSWAPTSALPMSAFVMGDCIEEYQSGPQTDVGQLTIPAHALQPSPHAMAPLSCVITVKLARRAQGTLDPAFGLGGEVIGNQVRTTTLTSTP